MYCDKIVNNKKKIRNSFILWGFVLITLIVATAAGANAGTGEPAQIIDKFDVEQDFDVRKALAMLGSLCDKNIVPSPNVNGALAFRSLRNITFEEAMDAILGENFKYEEQGKLIKVYTKDEYKQLKEDPARKKHEVFTLYYITAEEASKLIMPVLSADAVVQASTASEKTISGGSGGGGSVGSSSGSGGSSLGSGGGGDSMALNDKIVVYDFPEKIEMAREVIKSLDVKPKQVLVEATILSALLTEGMELGVDWNLMAGTALDGTAATQDYVSGGTVDRGTEATSPIAGISNITDGTPIETFGFATQGGNGMRIGVSSGDVRMLITAIESVTDVTVLANPKILAVNKQEGYVQIGQKLGYVDQTTQNQSGSTTQAVAFLNTGTLLTFRPYIGNDGYIRMDIFPKDSSGVIANNLPQETVTEVKTNVMVKDGETIVIGGLFRDVITTSRSQVPVLGDLPLVGVLFRGSNDKTERQEVIVLLTPHIIEEPGETEGAARAADISRKRLGAKEGLQWIDRARLAEDRYAKAVKLYGQNDIASAMKQLNMALELRPTYLEAIRLKERIISESSPEEAEKLERIMLDDIDRKNAPNWLRK